MHSFSHTEHSGLTTASQPNGGKPPRHRFQATTVTAYHTFQTSTGTASFELPNACVFESKNRNSHPVPSNTLA